MPYTWPIAPGVNVGEAITSAQQNGLANAFNARILSGLGDATFRIWWKAYAFTREFQQPAGFLSPAQDEWLEYYMHATPEDGATTGLLNFNAPLPAFVHGNEDLNLDAEDVALNALPTHGSTDPVAQWESGKSQRGAFDPSSLSSGAPAFDAAARASAFWSGESSNKFLSVWGGYLRGPESIPCGGYNGERFRFVGVRAGVATYTVDTCGRQVFVQNNSDHYAVTVIEGASTSVRRLAYSDYLFLPERPTVIPSHATGWQMHEASNAFASSLRGSEAQRAGDDFSIQSVGFDFEKFFTRQYYLAPARGYVDETNHLVSDYHQFQFNATGGELPRLSKALDDGVADNYDFGTAFCFAGYKVTASGLSEPVSIQLQHVGGTLLLENPSLSITNGERVYWFAEPETGTLEIVAMSVIPSGALITFELAPLLVYKPGLLDAYVVTRRGSCRDAAPDRGGWDFGSAKSLSDNYFACACVVNGDACAEVDEPNIQDNPVYEATRRMLRDHLRLFKRESFQSYSVEGGKAVLRFGRTVGGLDAWSGFAPPLTAIASGQLRSEVEYKVKGATGSVTYAGTPYAIGDTFLARPGIRDYTATGDAGPHQVNGIITGAPESGQTNEWTLFLGFTTYDGGAFQIEDYSDPLGMLVNRCSLLSSHLASGGEGYSEAVGAIADAPPSRVTQPKTPTGWAYAEGANAAASNAFFSSCKIYQPDYVVERVEYDADGLVKVTLSGPLRSANGTERQDDNGLMDYRAFVDTAVACPKRVGDLASDAPGDITNGSCIPRFYFTRQIPRVYVDTPTDNTTQEDEDTRCLAERMQWMDWVIDAMAPGYLDRQLSNVTGDGCAPRFINYTKDTLFYHATGTRWQPLLRIEDRPDNAQSFGALPNTILRVSKFNALVAAINLLVTVPVMLPTPLEYEATTTTYKTTDGLATSGAIVWRTLAANETPGGELISTEVRPWFPNPVSSSVLFYIYTFAGVRNFVTVLRQARFRISAVAFASNAFTPIINQLLSENVPAFAISTITETRYSEQSTELPPPCGLGGIQPWNPLAPIRPKGRTELTFDCLEIPVPETFFSANEPVLIEIPMHPGGIVAMNFVNLNDGCGYSVSKDSNIIASGVGRITVPFHT